MNETGKNKRIKNFIEMCQQIEMVEFVGVSSILGVKLVDDDGNTRQFETVFLDMIEAFQNLPKAQQKDFLKVLKLAVKEQSQTQ